MKNMFKLLMDAARKDLAKKLGMSIVEFDERYPMSRLPKKIN